MKRSTMISVIATLSIWLVPREVHARGLRPTSFPGTYFMVIEGEQIPSVAACVATGAMTFEDARTQKLVGERVHEDDRKLKQSITMIGDVVQWVRDGFSALSNRAALRTEVPGKPILKVRIVNLWVDEVIAYNAEYGARLVLDIVLRSADGTRSCYESRIDAFADNYGSAGKTENYQETVNEALDRAILKMINAKEFSDALCGCEKGPR